MSSEGTVVMIGLPGSGKTTFLAALWHQLESGEIPTVFTAETLQEDREYLNKIREAWLGFEEIPRTPVGIERSALLHLRHVSTGSEYDLSIPNVAGETFATQWLGRQTPQNYIERLRASFGLILFVHCRQVVRPEIMTGATLGKSTSAAETVEWDPSLAPTQVQLVDLLQTALSVFERRRVMRVALVVSAWDEVEVPATPESWLERSLPLLSQFIRANGDVLSCRVFGVSAIGGKLENREALALTPSPSSRVRVHVDSETLRDLTLPLEFLTKTARES
jgi:hypothetical protein